MSNEVGCLTEDGLGQGEHHVRLGGVLQVLLHLLPQRPLGAWRELCGLAPAEHRGETSGVLGTLVSVRLPLSPVALPPCPPSCGHLSL